MPNTLAKQSLPWEQNLFALLVKRLGAEPLASVLEYEASEVLSKAKRNSKPTIDEARLLNPLLREILETMKAEQTVRDEGWAFRRDFLLVEASRFDEDEQNLRILIRHVVNEIERVSGHTVTLQWFAMLDGRIWWRVEIDDVRVDGDQFRIPHRSQIKIGDALHEGIMVILDEVGIDMTTLRYASDQVHEIIDDLHMEHLTFAIEAYRELKEGKTIPIPDGLKAWVESDPEFVWEPAED